MGRATGHLAMPWATRIHVTWLALHTGLVLYVVAFGAGTMLQEGGRQA